MPSMKSFLIVGIIVLFHLMLFLWITSDSAEKTEEKAPENAQQETVQEEQAPAAVTPAPAAPKSDKQPQSAPQKITPAPAKPVQSPTAISTKTGAFTKVDRRMPQKIEALTRNAASIVVIDQDSRQILWEKNSTQQRPIASISKLMTALLVMEKITSGQASLNDTITVTTEDKKIMNRWGHGCFIAPGQTYTLQELLKAMIISSANDCAYLAGRLIAGSNSHCIEMMNLRAKGLGLTTLLFHSTNGHPNTGENQRQENYGSALDVAMLADITTRYPEIMKWAGTKQDRLRENTTSPFDLNATNHLLRDKVPGVTGLKTGFTDAAGYCMVTTCERSGRHILIVILGVPKDSGSKARDFIAKNLLDWAYATE